MRTTVRRLSTTLALLISVFALTALPALAADDSVQTDNPEVNGILLSLVIGSIVGALLFLDAYAGDPGHREHHGDEAGH